MKKSIFSFPVLFIAIIAIFSSCKNNDLGKQRQIELQTLKEFIQANYPDSLPKSSGLYYIELEAGNTDDTIKAGDKVQIFYATWTIDSTLIDETNGYLLGQRYEPFEFTVGAGKAIQGLEEAATYMHPGGKANLVIPSEIAYGQNGTYGVSGFTTLLMQVEVYKVYPAGQ
ncbi:MAG TPA: FKBP-type peptidyl-prolyl cis-trans isomerase [Draconibacterium sp.]|nr:FKBP-type peptidyl-prolyl cis-trans isomerase [Draconibacterium sp.]